MTHEDLVEEFRRIRYIVIGADGDNGLRSEVKTMKSEMKCLFEKQNKFLGALFVVSFFLTPLVGAWFYSIIK